MICPVCNHNGNLMGADTCLWCLFDLSAIDRPVASDRVERSLMTEPVAVLKPKLPVTVTVTATLGHVIQQMIAKQVSAVLVTDANNQLVGILTERDFLTKVAGSAHFRDQPVELFMTRHPEAVTMMDPLAFALGKMSAGGYRHLPVVANGEPKGIVSVRDLLRHIMRLCRESDLI